MRIVLSLFIFFQMIYASEVNNPKAIQQAIEGKDQFSFFYAGHAYGAPPDQRYWSQHDYKYPSLALLKNMEVLKKFDFAVFGGDVVQWCNKKNINILSEHLFDPLDMPILNSIGNHDACLPEYYHFDQHMHFIADNNLFLILNTPEFDFAEEDSKWFIETLEENMDQVENIFIFTHRPFFILVEPKLYKFASKINHVLDISDNALLQEKFTDLAQQIEQKGKQLYWFSGDIGMVFPLLYHDVNKNVHFIASALFEKEVDNAIAVHVQHNKVLLDVMSLSDYKYDQNISYYDLNWLRGYLILNNSDSKQKLQDMLVKQLPRLEREIPVTDQVISDKKYRLYQDKKRLIYYKEDCKNQENGRFFLHLYPENDQDLVNKVEKFNNFDFSADEVVYYRGACFVVKNLPDYALEHIDTGQFTKESGRIWWSTIDGQHLK